MSKRMMKHVRKITIGIRRVLFNDEGIGVVEVILILVVLIGLVIIFQDQLTALVESIFSRITSESSRI